MRYRSHGLTLDVTHETLRIAFRQGWAKTAKIGFRKQVYELMRGTSRVHAVI